MRKLTILLLFGVGLLSFGLAGAANSGLVKYGKGYRYSQDGWVYIHIEGAPYQRGVQYGYLVASELKPVITATKHLVYHDFGKKWSYFKRAAIRMMLPHVGTEYLQEMKGIAAGARKAGYKVSWQDILTWNGYEELVGYWWPHKRTDHCSAFIATGGATRSGQIVMAHNTFDSLPHGSYANIVLSVKPAHGHSFVMQTYPGFIDSGTDFFETDAGIIGTETTIADITTFAKKGIPEFIRMRRATQYANNIKQWIAIMLKKNNGAYANDWFLGNIKTGQIVQFELGMKYHHIWKTKNGYFIGFNGARDPRIRNLEADSSANYFDVRSSVGARRVRLTQLMKKYYGKVNMAVAKRIMADHYDVYLKKINPSSRTVDNHYILDPIYHSPADSSVLPFQPERAVDSKITNSKLAKVLAFYGRWGSPSGMAFNAKKYLTEHPQWDYLADYLIDMPSQPWTLLAGVNQ